jgi:hypothetical protein
LGESSRGLPVAREQAIREVSASGRPQALDVLLELNDRLPAAPARVAV